MRVSDLLHRLLKQTATPVTVDDVLNDIAVRLTVLEAVGNDHQMLAGAYEASAKESLALAQENRLEAARAQEAVAKLEDVVNFA